MSSTDGWLNSLRLDPDAHDPGVYPIGFCFKCFALKCYMPAFRTLSREIACIGCGSGPGSHIMQTGVVPIPQLPWQVNHAQFTTIKPPTIEELHLEEHCNVDPVTSQSQRPRPTDLPLEIEAIRIDDHVTLGSEDEEKSPITNHHRGRVNSTIDEEVGDMQQEHGPAQE